MSAIKRFVVARWWAFRPELKLRRHCLCSQSKQARWLKALVMFIHPLRWINKLMGRGAQRAKRFACSHVGVPTHLFVIYSSIYIYFFILDPKLHHLHQAIRWEDCVYSFLEWWLGRLWFSCHCSRQSKKTVILGNKSKTSCISRSMPSWPKSQQEWDFLLCKQQYK